MPGIEPRSPDPMQKSQQRCLILFSFQTLQLVTGFGDREVVRLATHPDSKHYLALTSDSEVYSWGNNDGGRLGHGDSM